MKRPITAGMFPWMIVCLQPPNIPCNVLDVLSGASGTTVNRPTAPIWTIMWPRTVPTIPCAGVAQKMGRDSLPDAEKGSLALESMKVTTLNCCHSSSYICIFATGSFFFLMFRQQPIYTQVMFLNPAPVPPPPHYAPFPCHFQVAVMHACVVALKSDVHTLFFSCPFAHSAFSISCSELLII